MKLVELIEYSKRNILLPKSCRKQGERIVPDIFLFFKKALNKDENKWSAALFHNILVALKLAYNINKLYKTLGLWIQI